MPRFQDGVTAILEVHDHRTDESATYVDAPAYVHYTLDIDDELTGDNHQMWLDDAHGLADKLLADGYLNLRRHVLDAIAIMEQLG